MPLATSSTLVLLTTGAVGVSGQCGYPILVTTSFLDAGVKVARACCRNLSRQLNELDSNASRYVEYVTEQGAKYGTQFTCTRYCGIDLASNLGTGLNTLFGGLQATCEDDGGTYDDQIF